MFLFVLESKMNERLSSTRPLPRLNRSPDLIGEKFYRQPKPIDLASAY